jgi:fatty-acid peroxygenase
MYLDRTLGLFTGGYDYLSRRRAGEGRETFPLRLMGQRATCVVGPDGARFFYDAASFDRIGVVPPSVQKTLSGDAGVQLLDGEAHRRRKAMFTSVLDAAGTRELVDEARRAWRDEVASWEPDRDVVLFDAAAQTLARAVHTWAGVPLPGADVPGTAAEMVAMVDGFASAGRRFFRARTARLRQEQRLEQLTDQIRAGRARVPPGTPMDTVLRHRDHDGSLLDRHTVAVELINLLRPTVAVAWYLAYAAHALRFWPAERARLLTGSGPQAVGFAHEVRRFYPFAPFLVARAVRDLSYDGLDLPRDSLAVLDVFGHNHHADLWPSPYVFDSGRHHGREPGTFELVPQGGGDVETGHRCPGEPATVGLLAALAPELARLEYTLPDQDLRVTRRRIPARVRSGMVLRPLARGAGQSGAQQ